MLQKEQWMQIHVLKAQGVSEREIARRLGISRNTVARYLSAEEVPRYKPREPRPTKLGAFEAYILDRMAAAAPEIIAAPALLRELRARATRAIVKSGVRGSGGMIRRPALEEPVCFQSPG
ncbi:helix-turn-helix domain-containing protein, partial [Burkholderia sp. DN3021]|uniref:helix-turn-helix domain-containing protein n=1 Tax=Burkholderia sp. DN3021 TaxID=3410137 RepID=UPI003C7C7BA5